MPFPVHMQTRSLIVQMADNPDEAPKYDPVEHIPLRIEKAVVVGRGTEKDLPTVDLQLTDMDGNQFLVMATGAILHTMVKAINMEDKW